MGGDSLSLCYRAVFQTRLFFFFFSQRFLPFAGGIPTYWMSLVLFKPLLIKLCLLSLPGCTAGQVASARLLHVCWCWCSCSLVLESCAYLKIVLSDSVSAEVTVFLLGFSLPSCCAVLVSYSAGQRLQEGGGAWVSLCPFQGFAAYVSLYNGCEKCLPRE